MAGLHLGFCLGGGGGGVVKQLFTYSMGDDPQLYTFKAYHNLLGGGGGGLGVFPQEKKKLDFLETVEIKFMKPNMEFEVSGYLKAKLHYA